MLHFRKLSITDRAWAQPFIEAENSRSADYNFGNIYMWDGAFRQHLTSVDGRLLTKLRYEDMPFFAFPIGSGDVKPSIEALTEFAAHRRYPLAIRGITEEHRALLEEAYPGRFRFFAVDPFVQGIGPFRAGSYLHRTAQRDAECGRLPHAGAFLLLAGKLFDGGQPQQKRASVRRLDTVFFVSRPALVNRLSRNKRYSFHRPYDSSRHSSSLW